MTTTLLSATAWKSNIWKLYLFFFFQGLVFAYVIERLFGLERGLTVQDMVYVEVAYAAIVLLLEVPTGALADRWSRKKMIIISAIFSFFEFFILIFAHNIWMFILSACAAAIGGAFASGTINALFYDSLKAIDQEKEYEKVLGRSELFEALAGGIAAVFGAAIASRFSLTLPYIISLVSIIISIVIAFTLHDPPIKTSTEEVKFFEHIKDAWNIIRRNHALLFMIFYGIFVGSAWIYLDEYWQIYAQSVEVPIAAFGVVSLCFLGIRSICSMFAYKLKKILSYKTIFSILLLISTLSLITAGFIKSWWGILFLFLAYGTYYFTEPLLSGYIHHQIESKHRATVDSLYSLLLRFGSLGIGLAFGFVATQFSIFWGITFLGILLLVYALLYLPLQVKFLKKQ